MSCRPAQFSCAGQFVESEGSYADGKQNGCHARWKTDLANVDTAVDLHVPAIFL